jgi:Rad3-related DNA helicase
MWSLYSNKQKLNPLVFSNGKTQEDIVKETLDAIKEGYKVIFIKGMCGTGKSAIALNIARQLGKTSIVVPIKSLQEQYIKDYTDKLHILDKKNENKLKINSILGRNNFPCNYLKEEKLPTKQQSYKEKNSKLSDIFAQNKSTNSNNNYNNDKDDSCDNYLLPCKIEIKEKNISQIKFYLNKNPLVKIRDFHSINNVKRMSIAPVCDYYSPILPEEIEINFRNSTKISYKGLNFQNFTIHQRKPGCPFYDQYISYTNSDVIIFNSLKYKLESLMNRKPETEIEIIDECDEFLDSFANIEKINLNRLLYSLNMIFSETEDAEKIIKKLIEITEQIKNNYGSSKSNTNDSEIFPLSGSLIEELILTTISNSDFLNEVETEESSYIFHLNEVAKIFYDFLNESFFTIEKKENEVTLNIVTTNLEKRFQELINKNKTLVLMSGTIHSQEVLSRIYGLEKFKIIDAETKPQGELIKCKHGYELDCKYSNFQSGKITRENYLKTFSKTINSAKKPILIHLTSFADLPTQFEKEKLNLDLPSQIELRTKQNNDPLGKRIEDFKNKKTNILFTTKCSRGIDFPGDMCNSIVISRFPYPNISSIFWKILKKTNPQDFMSFYMDKSKRELLQKVYRGLRSKEDRLYLLSPDVRVVNFEFNQ